MENWKPIEEFEGLYMVSDKGRVKSKWRIRKQSTSHRGYSLVSLCKENKPKTHLVHRLVAKAFIPNDNNLPEVNHMDGNKKNNDVTNLEWVTKSENERHSFRHLNHPMPIVTKMFKGKFGKEHIRSRAIMQYSLSGIFIKEWECMLQVERELGISHGNISSCCQGKRRQVNGFIFRYK